MRNYNPPVPDCNEERTRFNQYLRDNNTLVSENGSWILIKNSYIEEELVCWYKEIGEVFNDINAHELHLLQEILEPFQEKKWYINNQYQKSIPRFHIHIEL